MTDREMLARLCYYTGQYIECDERPRPVAVWAAMAAAQGDAAIHLNMTRPAEGGDK